MLIILEIVLKILIYNLLKKKCVHSIVEVERKNLKTKRQWQGNKLLAYLPLWSIFFTRGIPAIKKYISC